ncbi:FtsX-like permease family protein, partial [Staphylococcus kloosii]|uniref:ABC transporter permease n=1 Tax=Staphylococcus kloosii TaxID=29384 RepID=UPI0028A4EA41
MTLFRIAIKNIKENFNSYLIYFISMIFSMIIYYTFVSLQYNEKIKENIKLSDTMDFMFMGTSIILILFVSIFIIYSNTFFIRRRKKEVGIYSILGLRKKTIARMLFYENILMGIISLIIGIFLGTLLSKFFSLILMKLMGTSISIDFSISYEAIVQTTIVFIIIILFTSIQCYKVIYRFKLIELLYAEKKGEEIPRVSLLSAIIGFSLLIVSYYLILRPLPDNLTNSYITKNYGL